MANELALRVKSAIAVLLTRPEETLPFLIIMHWPTRQFVQFAGSRNKPLWFDVPDLKIGRDVKPDEDPTELALTTLKGLLNGQSLDDGEVVLSDETSPENKAARASEEKMSVLSPCHCGGHYQLGYDAHENAMLTHTIPFCARFMACDTDQDAVRFSEENRRLTVS